MGTSGYWGGGKECSLGRTLYRFIKRKKFDDELVESSLAKSSTRAKGASGVEPGRCSGSEPSSSEKKKVRDWEMRGVEGMGSSARFCVSPPPLPAGKSLQRRLVRGPGCPSPILRCLPPGSTSLPAPPFLLHPPPCQCILYHILCGRHGACIYSGSRQPVPSIAGCKNNPQVALLWPQTLYQQECFPGVLPTHPPLWGWECHQQREDPIWFRTM